MGQRLVWREKNLLLQDGAKGLRVRIAAALGPTTEWAPTGTRYWTVRLQCRLPSLLPLFNATVESQQAQLVLYKYAERLPEQHTSVIACERTNELDPRLGLLRSLRHAHGDTCVNVPHLPAQLHA